MTTMQQTGASPRPIVPGLFLSLHEAARRSSLSLRTIHRAVADGRLPSFKIDRRRVVSPEALDAFVRTVGGAAR